MSEKHANAFILLKISPETSIAELEDAKETASFDERASDTDLQNAAGALSAPKTRLPHEMSYLWGVPFDDVDDIINLAKTAQYWQELLDEIEVFSMPATGMANMAAMFCARQDAGELPDIEDALNALIATQKEINLITIIETIQQARKESGFNPVRVDESHVTESLKELRTKHIDAAINAIRGHEHPGNLATALTKKWRANKKESGRFVMGLLDLYKNVVMPTMRELEDEIDRAIDDLRENSHDKQAIAVIEDKLSEWDEYAQPLQLIEEKKGFDEQVSRKVFIKLRELALHLHNEEGATEMSLRINQLLVKVFEELPEASELAAKDATTLQEILLQKGARDDADKEASKRVKDFQNAMESIRNPSSESNARRASETLIGAFQQILRHLELSDDERLWDILRGVAISLHNEHHYTDVSVWIVTQLKDLASCYDAPSSIKQKLREDGQVLTEMVARQAASKMAAQHQSRQENDGCAEEVGKIIFWIFILMIIFTFVD